MTIITLIVILIVYFVGFILTRNALIKHGVEWGYDYSEPKTYANYDDWDNNEQAWTALAMAWLMFVPINVIAWTTTKLIQQTKHKIDGLDSKNTRKN
jgi:hypothetical protein